MNIVYKKPAGHGIKCGSFVFQWLRIAIHLVAYWLYLIRRLFVIFSNLIPKPRPISFISPHPFRSQMICRLHPLFLFHLSNIKITSQLLFPLLLIFNPHHAFFFLILIHVISIVFHNIAINRRTCVYPHIQLTLVYDRNSYSKLLQLTTNSSPPTNF